MGVHWIHPEVCPPVLPSANKASGTFWKKNFQINSFHTCHLPLWGESLLTYIHFHLPSINFDPPVAKYLTKIWVSVIFWQNYWLSCFHTWHLLYVVSLFPPIHFSIFWVPSYNIGPHLVATYWTEYAVSGTYWRKLLTQLISYLAFTHMGWVSWPVFIFTFRSTTLAPWRPHIGPKMQFPEHFEKLLA